MTIGDKEGGELVGSGSFRVDRQKALEKLREFRRRDVGAVMLFARCAAAAGARRLSIEQGPKSIELRFDGAPFSREEMVDPYAALFGTEGAAEERTRWLALALVHAWRPSLSGLSLASGPAGARSRLEASEFGGERVDRDDSVESETVVRLELAREDDAHWRHPIPPEMIHCRPRSHLWGRMAVEVRRGGAAVSRVAAGPQAPGELIFEEDGVFGHISIPPDGSDFTTMDAYLHGVYAGRLGWGDARAAVVGKIEDPGLSLDASLAAIVRNERLERIEALVRRQTDALIYKVAAEQGERMGETAKLLGADAVLRRLWSRRLAGPEVEAERGAGALARLRTLLGLDDPARAARVLHDACATAWLREIAAEFTLRKPAASDRALAAVVDAAPVAFDAGWRPVGCAELRAAFAAKRLAVADEPARRAEPGRIAVWYDGASGRFWELFGR
ncbi:MAG: hypothetical protein HYZ75_16030 [Elusimicrobia bacterium]|nr:hypothetical protein [Elusimicrobiota bacterium]